MRTNAGFPCPSCASVFKNARGFLRHILKRHNLKCKPIADPNSSRFIVQESPIQSTSASSDSISYSFIDTDTDTFTDTNISTDTVGFSSVYSFEFPPPAANYRFIFMNMDISECFHNFQLAIKAKIGQDPLSLTLEEHVQHILSLSGIPLLKPARTHADLHQHIDLDICDRLLDHILTSHLLTRCHVFPSDIKNLVGEIVKRIVDSEPLDLPTYTGPYTYMYASREIMILVEGVTFSQTNRVLLIIRNLMECLPRHIWCI
ncbi:hypothetical protein RMCBS344292_16979 [Rhizopus microsporus]|nr:hypothetical protein RMCBS344292_16979 [Rhizopus microsporus]